MVYQVHKWHVPGIWKIAIVMLMFIWLLDGAGWVGWMRVAISSLVMPPLKLASYLVAQQERSMRYLAQLSRAGRGNLDLARQVQELRVQADKVIMVEEENKELRQVLNIGGKRDVPGISGRVVRATGGEIRGWFEQEVANGALVICQGRVIGVVEQGHGNWARIVPIGTGQAQLVTRVLGEQNTPLGKVAKAGSELVVERVSKEQNIPVGSLVVTAGDPAGVTPNLPIARVKEVTSTPESLYQVIKLEPVGEIGVDELVIAIGGEQ